MPSGGAGAVTQAMASAAKAAGAEIRTGAEVIEIRVQNGAATGVLLSTGEEIQRESRHLQRRSEAHAAQADRSDASFARLRAEAAALSRQRHGGESESRALWPAKFHRAEERRCTQRCKGRIHIGNEIDYLERAFDESKYGNFSRQPYLEAAIPSLTDPTLAPEGKHVMSIYMQYAPYKLKGDWEEQRKALGQTVVQTLAQYAPNLPELILTHQIITPRDLEEKYGLTGGQIFHGELGARSVLHHASAAGLGAVPHAD